MSFDQLAPAVLQLPPRERAILAESLWESLEDPYCLSAALSDEEALRLAVARDTEIESGAVTPVPHDEIMRRLRR
jgi:putative addiction module component (TIGR02574 family)